MVAPIGDEDRAVIDRVIADQAVQRWLDEHRSRNRFSAFFGSPETLRTLLTAVAIPLIGWLAVLIYAQFDAVYNRDAHDAARAAAEATRLQAETRSDVERVSVLMPYLSGTPNQQEMSLPVLAAMAEAHGATRNPYSEKMFAALHARAYLDSQSPVPEISRSGLHRIELLNNPNAPAGSTSPAAPTGGQPPTARASQSSAAVPPSLAYIQFYGANDRALAQSLADAFRHAGVPVAGIDDVVRSHPDSAFQFPQRDRAAIRFYRAGDEGAARFSANLVQLNARGAPPELRQLNVPTQRTGIVEIWLPCTLAQCVRPAPHLP